MIISNLSRLWLYIGMTVLPVWIDWLKLSTDVSWRGLAMPLLTSISAAIIVVLAKTSPPADTAQKKITEISGDKEKTTETIIEKHPKTK